MHIDMEDSFSKKNTNLATYGFKAGGNGEHHTTTLILSIAIFGWKNNVILNFGYCPSLAQTNFSFKTIKTCILVSFQSVHLTKLLAQDLELVLRHCAVAVTVPQGWVKYRKHVSLYAVYDHLSTFTFTNFKGLLEG